MRRVECVGIVWSLVFAYYYVGSLGSVWGGGEEDGEIEFSSSVGSVLAEEPIKVYRSKNGLNKYAAWEVPGVNCTPPGIDDFPPDLFSQGQRQAGWVVVHFMVSLYIFVGLAVVCDDYFVPSMELISERLHLPSDVAGATFMAIATSAPELFTNIIGTFITHGDIGVGTIVGSAVFNILAVAAVCGLGAGMVVPLEWYPVTRDCMCYLFTVFLLLFVLRDERIYWWEALILVLVYLLYILVMYKNATLKRGAEKLVSKAERRLGGSQTETTYVGKDIELPSPSDGKAGGDDVKDDGDTAEGDEEEGQVGICRPPSSGGCRSWTEWVVCWPCKVLFFFTVPDCRKEGWKAWYPLTFTMCIVWIGTLSYVVNWMMTIIGHTCKIPDSVMGLTFIAAGTSVPEVVSSLIVARQGLGTMAVSNSIGSNTFDVLMCLGIPWLIQALSLIGDPVEDYIQINSKGLEYSTMMLITSVGVLYFILACNRFVLDRRVGLVSLALYASFLLFASLFELNVFLPVNLPTCQYHED